MNREPQKMSKQRSGPQPHLQTVAATIVQAMAQKGYQDRDIARLIGLRDPAGGAVRLWRRGIHPPTKAWRGKLASTLDLAETALIPMVPQRRRKASPVTIPAPAPPAANGLPAYTITGNRDGTAYLEFSATLDFARAIKIIQTLVEFGLVANKDAR